MHLITTGGVYPPSPKFFGDFFTETLPDAAQVLPRALELAQEMADHVSPLASSMSRALMWEGPRSPEEAHLLESRVFHHMVGQRYVTERVMARRESLTSCRDYKEGVNSFLEKRNPHFETDPREHSYPNYPWWSETNISLEPSVAKDSKL